MEGIMLDNQQNCNICGSSITYTIGGFNNYSRRGICEECHKNRKTKVCKACKQEKPIEQFSFRTYCSERISQCRACTSKKQKATDAKKPKVKKRKVGKVDGELANDLTKMRW